MPDVGEQGFEVEWWPQNKRNLAIAADEDRDYSEMDCEFRVTKTIESARALAERVAKQSMFSSAMIRPVTYNKYGRWEHGDDAPEEVCV